MNQLPAFLINRKSRNLAQAAVKGLGGSSPPYISIKANRFTLIDGAGNEKPHDKLSIDVVIVDVNQHVSKIYYEGEYDAKAESFVGPTCFSDNGVAPSAQATKPQHSVCATCPHNQWGSAISKMTGKQTKECNDAKKLAVLVPGHGMKMVFQLRVPPATLKNFKAYAQLVSSATIGDRPTDLSDIVTRVEFEGQGVLKFTPVDYIDEETASRLGELDETEETAILVGRNDTPIQGQIAAPAREPTKEAVIQATAKAPVEEPKPRGRPAGAKNKPKETGLPFERPTQVAAEEEPEEIPAFLQRNRAEARGPVQDEPVTAPDSTLQAAIANAFKLPT